MRVRDVAALAGLTAAACGGVVSVPDAGVRDAGPGAVDAPSVSVVDEGAGAGPDASAGDGAAPGPDAANGADAGPPLIDFYVSSLHSSSVLRVKGVSHVQTVEVIASGPPLSEPHGLALDPRGDLYLADHAADELFLFRGATGPAVAFDQQAGMGPIGLALGPDGALYIGGFGSGALERYDRSGSLLTTTLDPAGNSFLLSPSGLTFGPDGMLYVSINASDKIERVNPATGADLGVFASYPGLVKPSGLRFGRDGRLYVVDWGGARVLRFDGATGAFVDVFVAAGAGGISEPVGLEFGPDGNLYVCDYGGDFVAVFDGATGASKGAFISAADGFGLSGPTWMQFVTNPP